MNKLLALLFACALFISASAQDDCTVESWRESMFEFDETDTLSINLFNKYDFSHIWLDNRSCYLGYIGDDYQRLHIKFTKVKKQSPLKYAVKGITRVKNNICNFEGEINIIRIRGIVDFSNDMVTPSDTNGSGTVLAKFTFKEDKKQNGTGIFLGELISYWYIDKNRKLCYDPGEKDLFNNQYFGKWTSYKTGKEKKCAWGQGWPPCSNELNISSSDFFVDPKYRQNGWELPEGEWDYCVNSNLFDK